VFEPSKVCAVAEFVASKDFAVVFVAGNSCEIVELRFKEVERCIYLKSMRT
jgi:hypothetical protein